jgi:hypothetical protein
MNFKSGLINDCLEIHFIENSKLYNGMLYVLFKTEEKATDFLIHIWDENEIH